ncbi:helix-turn-helix domain-containing protein [Gorillibacterium sp. sgz500922]|uniref:helix-turn-helix domain-containing protein n=1 Tax=Gorillibacterium sp. sgz500922 TaxID=3446694 RepID=UPI003F661134
MSELRIFIGNRIRAIRNAKGLTQQKLADASGLDYRYIGALERGERNFSIDTLEKVMQALKVTLKDIAPIAGPVLRTRQEALDEFMALTEELSQEQLEVIRNVNREIVRGFN